MGVAPVQREIDRIEKRGAAQSSGYKTRKSARRHLRSSVFSKPHHRITNELGSRARNTHPPRSPKHERAADVRTKKESAQPPKVRSGATVADFQDQCSVAAPNRAAGSTSAPAPELPSQSVSAPVTGRRKTPPVEANERRSKKTKVAKPSIKERRSSAPSELPVRPSAKRKTPPNLASSGSITELDRDLAHIGAMAQECHADGHFAPVYTFDNAAEDIPDDGDDLYDITMAGRSLYVRLEKEPNAAIFPKQRLPDKCFPLIWAQVGRMGYSFLNIVSNMISSRDRKCASPLTASEVFKVVFIIASISSKDIFLADTPPSQFSVCSRPKFS